jgi:hypothetical protein
MAKYITEIFAEQIIDKVRCLYFGSMFFPDSFKTTWFEGVNPTGQYKIENCILDDDGLWRSKEMDSSDGKGHNTQYTKFLWRIEPNYCTAGRISYSQEQINEFYRKSETKKYLLKFVKSQVCLEWDGFDLPTETHWGLRQRAPFITIYENGERIYRGISIYNSKYKKHLKTFIMSYYSWEK